MSRLLSSSGSSYSGKSDGDEDELLEKGNCAIMFLITLPLGSFISLIVYFLIKFKFLPTISVNNAFLNSSALSDTAFYEAVRSTWFPVPRFRSLFCQGTRGEISKV